MTFKGLYKESVATAESKVMEIASILLLKPATTLSSTR